MLVCSGVLYGAMAGQPSPSSRAYAAVCLISWVLFSRTVLLGLFVAITTEAFDLREEQQLIAAPGRLSAILAAIHQAGTAVMAAMEAMARAEEESGGQAAAAQSLRAKGLSAKRGERDGAEDDDDEFSSLGKRNGGGYVATYAVATIVARRKRLSTTSDAILKIANAQVLEAGSLNWLDAVPILPMRTVLQALMPPTPPAPPVNAVNLVEKSTARSNKESGGKSARSGNSENPSHGVARSTNLRGAPGKDIHWQTDEMLAERTLFLLSPSNPVRITCVQMARSNILGLVVHLSVLLSSALLVAIPAAEDLPGQGTTLSVSTRQTIELVTTCIFSVEFLLLIASQVL